MTSLTLCLATVLLGTNFSSTTMPTHTQTAAVSVNTTRAVKAEQQYIKMINAERWSRNLNSLVPNNLLTLAARQHSREMAELRYFDHYSPTPDLRSPMTRYIKILGYTPSYARIGENLYYCSKYNVARGHKSLMKSLPHRENILNEQYSEVGVGCYVSPDGKLWVTQMFLKQTITSPIYTQNPPLSPQIGPIGLG